MNSTIPHNIEAEQCILGPILSDNELYWKVCQLVSTKDFYRRHHQVIAEEMFERLQAGKPVDEIILANSLTEKKQDFGGMEYLQTLLDVAPLAGNVEYYATIVKTKAIKRELVSAGQKIISLGMAEDGPVEDALAKAEDTILEIGKGISAEVDNAYKLIDNSLVEWAGIQSNTIVPVAHNSGLVDLDSLTGGFCPGRLIVIAARPGMGKTSLGLNILSALAKSDKCGLLFSLEMTKKEIGDRLICSEARVCQQVAVNAFKAAAESKASEGDKELSRRLYKELLASGNKLSDKRFFVDDKSNRIDEICAVSSRIHAKEKLDLIMVDYLNIVDGGKGDNRNLELGGITRKLKQLAKRLGVATILMCQLNREVDKRQSTRPVLSDLRDSGEIEQNADQIIFIYRPSEYGKEDEKDELILAKNRHGSTGTVRVKWFGEYTRFDNLALGGRQI